MSARSFIVMVVLTWLIVLVGAVVALAEPVDKGAWYRSLMVPGTSYSCCDIADCAPAQATYRDGAWWVLPASGAPLPVPPAVILEDREPLDGISAYACIVGGTVRCFIRPGSGG